MAANLEDSAAAAAVGTEHLVAAETGLAAGFDYLYFVVVVRSIYFGADFEVRIYQLHLLYHLNFFHVLKEICHFFHNRFS